MIKSEFQKLSHGLYKIFWRSGGSSLATIGSNSKGERWIAPANWITLDIDNTYRFWKKIAKVEFLHAA